MTYIKTDTFIDIANQCNFDAKAIIAHIQEHINPNYNTNTTLINNRISLLISVYSFLFVI
jgi:hypothetical protein